MNNSPEFQKRSLYPASNMTHLKDCDIWRRTHVINVFKAKRWERRSSCITAWGQRFYIIELTVSTSICERHIAAGPFCGPSLDQTSVMLSGRPARREEINQVETAWVNSHNTPPSEIADVWTCTVKSAQLSDHCPLHAFETDTEKIF